MFRFHPAAFPVAAALAATVFPGTIAKAQSAKVLPHHATSTEGNSSCYYPFLYNACRAQVIWDGPTVTIGTGVLNSINFRRDTTNANYPALSLGSHVAQLGHTSVSPSTMSTTFASNITGTMTTLINGKYSLPALPAPNPGPAPWAISYPMTTPFIYTSANGNLLLDWTSGSGQATQKQDYQLDAVTTVTSGGTGIVRQFGTWGQFAGKDAAAWKADAGKLIPGGSANLSLAGFGQAYAANLIVGLSDTTYNGASLPFDLAAIGAPGNHLYTSIDLIVPLSLTQTNPGNYTANPSFAIPNDNKLIGLSAFIQSYYADSKANGAGLVASDAMELTIGNSGPIAQMVAQTDTTSATGGKMPFVPVIQFVGAIK